VIDMNQVQSISGSTVIDSTGDKIGRAGEVYLDDSTGQPDWVTVLTGLFGTRESFVPLPQASWDGENLRVPYTKDQVKGAPQIETGGHLSVEEEEVLYRHYGLDSTYASGTDTTWQETRQDTSGQVTTGITQQETTGYATADASRVEGTVGYDTSGPTTDDAMTRSEERLNVGVQRVEAGRARLRKYIVTDTETVTVPVSREEVRIEREPITDANRDAAHAGPELSEEEHEVVLHEERPMVEKEAVPVERVRLATDTVQEERQITEEVRREEITTGTDSDDLTDTTRPVRDDRI
jgi:uncharacterized protein (TIGR02271 family)